MNRPGLITDTAAGTPARWSPDDLGIAWNALDGHAETPQDVAERERRDAEQRIEEAHAAGYEAGRLDGELAASARLRSSVTAAEMALDLIRGNEEKWQHAVDENIAALAVSIARHIVGRELHTNGSAVAELVKRALAEFPIDQPMRVRVNPHDLSLISMPATEGGEAISIAPNRDVRWMADVRILPGGCVVEGRERIVDGRVDTALERLYRRLTDNDA